MQYSVAITFWKPAQIGIHVQAFPGTFVLLSYDWIELVKAYLGTILLNVVFKN